ncbi:Rhodanese-related sulfurtransferase [Enhydrobacter aerosaccus]|uniref:Rhodanese-related sulfurtransferase n=1 Tax=Enhydrobacter aerosaccus TaxID=225324 RepID=A0A1T4NPD1_9HYPH|nr:rhodanese-like domain-containing protein [Enhydrobacter aerosaccus]SJZ81042.1 Rhodanese-related sulfurtransferase [Enhydrobacter aerosaccus]
MTLHQQRAAAVRQLIGQAREIEKDGVTRNNLEKIGGLLAALAARSDLFPQDEFPLGGEGGIYRLSEDPDHRFALYASAGGAGKKVPPHNHTTWAIIAGVHGAERNVVYDRLDNGARPDVVQLREAPAKEKTLRRGDFIAFLPEDFHHIETPADSGEALHLHFYGLSLEHLPDRVSVDLATGAARRFMAKAKILTPLVSVQQVKAMLNSGEVFAFFDVREEGEFSTQGHPLFATPLPLSRLEPRALALLPDPDTRIVLMDSGEEDRDPQWQGRANRAAARLSSLGYTNLAVVKGGLKAWREAGYEVFTGVNVPSKAFGEVVEHDNDTPRIDAADLQKLIDDKADLVILDSRPMPEFHNMSIPGGVDCPGAELVYRVKDFAPRPETLVVVNCAGRTRSIIGAQSLINAGLPNKVMALKNGTMGWHLAGLKVARGETRSFGPQGADAAAFAQAAAAKLAERLHLKKINLAGLAALEAKGGPLYRLDVRDPAEYAQGHLKGFRHAAGGQLVQATDQYVGARNARIVLHDNDGVRATLTAHWLVQMGWGETYILDHKPEAGELTTEAEPRYPAGFTLPTPPTVSAAELNARLGTTLVIDLDTSLKYRDGHIPGAWFAVRANLNKSIPAMLAQQAGVLRIVLVSPDGEIATLAAPEAQEIAGTLPVSVLAGGLKSWRDAGLALETGHVRMGDPPTDVWYRPYDFKEDVEAAMRQYLEWEVDLVPQVVRDGDARFSVLKA